MKGLRVSSYSQEESCIDAVVGEKIELGCCEIDPNPRCLAFRHPRHCRGEKTRDCEMKNLQRADELLKARCNSKEREIQSTLLE